MNRISLTFVCILTFLFANLQLIISQEIKQNIRGVVLDADTRSPLAGASVIVQNIKPLLNASTNENGEFLIENVTAGRYNIKASIIGYEPAILYEINVGSGKEVFVEIRLKEIPVTTEVIEVTAQEDKDKPINSMALNNARSFTVDETSRFAGSLDDPLRAVTSFAGVTGNPSINSNEIIIRGNSPKGLLWKLEGVDIPNPNHFGKVSRSGGGLTIFSSQMLSNSDFFLSAFPSEYGNAVGGVFDIHFRTGNRFKRELGIQAGIQGLEAATEGPFIKGKESSYLINYRYSTLGLLSSFFPEIKNGIPNYQDIALKLNFPTGNSGVFSITGIGGLATQKYHPEQDTTKWQSISDHQKCDIETMMGALIFSHNYLAGSSTALNTSLAFTNNKITWDNAFMNADGSLDMTDDVKFNNSRISLYSTLTHKFGSSHTNRTGVVLSDLIYNVDIKGKDPVSGIFMPISNSKGNTYLLELFSSSRFTVKQNLNIIPGARFTYFFLNKHYAVEPRISVKYDFAKVHSISAGFGIHSQLENIAVYLAEKQDSAYGTTMPNKDLDFTRSYHFTLGYEWSMTENLRFKLEPYYQQLTNIPSAPNSSFTLLNYTDVFYNDSLNNNGKGKNYGVDITFEKFLNKGYYWVLTGSLFQSKYTGTDGIERSTKFNSGYALNFLFGGEMKVFKSSTLGLNLKLNYTGGEKYIPIDLAASIDRGREVLDYQSAYSRQYPAFLFADCSISLRTNYEHWSGVLSLQVKNLLNQRVSINYTYDPYRKSIDDEKTTGILPFISYKIEL